MSDAESGGRRARRRVVMVAACPFPQPRGTPTRIYRMSEALASRGHEVHVVTTHLGEEISPPPFEVHRSLRVPTYRRTIAGPTYQKLLLVDPLMALELLRVVRRVRPDVIHAHHYEGLAMALGVRSVTGVPVVYDAHTLLSTELSYYELGLTERAKRGIGSRIDRWLPPRADASIAVSDEIALVLRETAPAGHPVSVIGNGVEPVLLQRAEPDAARSFPQRLVYAGGFAPYQGTDLMLEAFSRVLALHPDVRLLVVSSEDNRSLHADVETRGLKESVDWLKSDFDGLRAALQQAPIALNPRGECSGLPQKLINYLAAGRAIVSCAGSARHLEDGVTGRIVPDGDAPAFADAIVELLEDPARAAAMGERSRRFALGEFSWDRNAARIEETYSCVLKDGARVE